MTKSNQDISLKIANFAVGIDGFTTAHLPLADMRFKPTCECPKGICGYKNTCPGGP